MKPREPAENRPAEELIFYQDQCWKPPRLKRGTKIRSAAPTAEIVEREPRGPTRFVCAGQALYRSLLPGPLSNLIFVLKSLEPTFILLTLLLLSF